MMMTHHNHHRKEKKGSRHRRKCKFYFFLCTLLLIGTIYVLQSLMNVIKSTSSSSSYSSTSSNIIFEKKQNSTTEEEGATSNDQQQQQQQDTNTTTTSAFDDFNFDELSRIPCGVDKCFIPSKTQPKDVGYLIGESILNRLKQGYEYAQYLQSTYNLTNIILLEPPYNVPRDFDLIDKLNSKLYRLSRPDDPKANLNKKFCTSQHQCGSIPLTIQKIKRVSTDSTFLVKCRNSKVVNRTRIEWKHFLALHNNNNNNDTTTTTTHISKTKEGGGEEEEFRQQFELSINQLKLILSKEPEFVNDIQFYVNIIEGKIIHMDYDRIVGHGNGWKSRQQRQQHDGANNIDITSLMNNDQIEFVQKATKYCLDFLEEMKHDIIEVIIQRNKREEEEEE